MAMAKVIGKGKFLKLVREGTWEFVERVNARGVVAIVALTPDRRILLTEQFRAAVGRSVIDLPAGLAGDVAGQEDEAFATSALRELIEETGYTAKRVDHLADCPTSPGLTSEIASFFIARDLRQVSTGGGVEGENIVVHCPTIRGIEKWLANRVAEGKLIDGKVYAGLHFSRRRTSSPRPGRRDQK
ncbi:NUDIX hydrolase [Schlesneria paludicola]|uniref:NUDIX hydrolase n=1 Tax=Schlesneria paludicola TaxID=360056 RepID=UPI00029A9EFF|nr:NUDIX hydrolase [Schlesneria paludicola]